LGCFPKIRVDFGIKQDETTARLSGFDFVLFFNLHKQVREYLLSGATPTQFFQSSGDEPWVKNGIGVFPKVLWLYKQRCIILSK